MSWQDKALAAFWADAFANEPLDSHRRIEAAIDAAAASLLPSKDAPMADQHSITPPPELVKQWWKEAQQADYSDGLPCWLTYVATQAARWGADQELEACCKWLSVPCPSYGRELRAERRPKPPSLAEEALEEINLMEGAMYSADLGCDFTATRRALERLQELENNG